MRALPSPRHLEVTMAKKKTKKHPCFAAVDREIKKKIREHKRRKKTANPKKRKELDLAICNLESTRLALRAAFIGRVTCPS